MIVSPIVSTITFALTTLWLSVGLGGLTYWFWASFIPRGDGTGEWGQYVSAALPWLFGGWSSWAVEVVLYLIAGVIFTITLPWGMSGLRALSTRSPVPCWAAGPVTTSPPKHAPRPPRAPQPCRRRVLDCDAWSATSTTVHSSAWCDCSSTSPPSSAAPRPVTRMRSGAEGGEVELQSHQALLCS